MEKIPLIRQCELLSLGNWEHKIYPYLLRGMKIVRSNQVWATDITYIRMKPGWLYLNSTAKKYAEP